VNLSREFIQALKLAEQPAYKLAWQVGLHPNTLSKYLIGYLKPAHKPTALIELGKILGLKPEEVFEEVKENGEA